MKHEFIERLISEFPIIYRGKQSDIGFWCGDGWFDIIYDLSAKLERIANAQQRPSRQNWLQKKLAVVSYKLQSIIGFNQYEAILNYCYPDTTDKRLLVLQVKEKFGGLRFYVDNSFNEVNIIINIAEEKSFRTCEKCGKAGETRYRCGWSSTLCDDDYKEIIDAP